MLNQTIMMWHHIRGLLPPLPLTIGQEIVVTGLKFLCLLIVRRLIWALATVLFTLLFNGILLVGSVFCVCRLLRYSDRQTDKMKQNRALACPSMIVMGYFGYRYHNNVSLWYQSAVMMGCVG
jgi:hypothetical protein